jgi:mannosylglycoprotein endo-beta-mannosidase
MSGGHMSLRDFEWLGIFLERYMHMAVQNTWGNLSAKVGGRDIIDWWQFMSGCLRQHLRGWARNIGVASKRDKEALMTQIIQLDVQADSSGLDDEEWAQRYYLEDQLLQIVGAEEEYWRQRGRVKWAVQGDANTAYFHAVANGRRRKCTISSINLGNEITNDPSKIQSAIYDFYRDLLGSEGNRTCSLSPRTWPTTSQVSLEDNNQLMITFTETELDSIVREMKSDTAPGPDGFPVLFFKRFWPNVKLGVLHILNDFMLGR